jgi:hypothetical protein
MCKELGVALSLGRESRTKKMAGRISGSIRFDDLTIPFRGVQRIPQLIPHTETSFVIAKSRLGLPIGHHVDKSSVPTFPRDRFLGAESPVARKRANKEPRSVHRKRRG